MQLSGIDFENLGLVHAKLFYQSAVIEQPPPRGRRNEAVRPVNPFYANNRRTIGKSPRSALSVELRPANG